MDFLYRFAELGRLLFCTHWPDLVWNRRSKGIGFGPPGSYLPLRYLSDSGTPFLMFLAFLGSFGRSCYFTGLVFYDGRLTVPGLRLTGFSGIGPQRFCPTI